MQQHRRPSLVVAFVVRRRCRAIDMGRSSHPSSLHVSSMASGRTSLECAFILVIERMPQCASSIPER